MSHSPSPLPPPLLSPPLHLQGFNLNNFSIYLLSTERYGTKIKQSEEEMEQILWVMRSQGFISVQLMDVRSCWLLFLQQEEERH